jgi:putative glutamine amidotransferase
MTRPVIGITSFSLEASGRRSAVNQQYIDAVVAAGGVAICIPLGLDQEGLDRIYSLLDGLLLPGGEDVAPARYGEQPHPKLGAVHEERDELELRLATRALEDGLPILGICRGIQVLAVAAGGTLYQDLPSQWGSEVRHHVREFGRDYLAHTITLERRSHFAGAISSTTARVNTFHHQAVKDMPGGFRISARSSDGLVEAIEARDERFVMGVQCHPEEVWRTTAPELARLFVAFVHAAS